MIDNKTLSDPPAEIPNYHERQAAHLRALAENATTPKLKARLLNAADEHERLARADADAVESLSEA